MLYAHRAETFFSGHSPSGIPRDTDTAGLNVLVERSRTLDPSSFPLDTIKTILARENRRIGAGQTALDSLESIGPGTVFVICGQQAGLFGGPLYTLYKAMHTVRLSRILTEQSGRTVIPLFWVASDDHDFQEVRTLGLKTDDGHKAELSYTPREYVEGAPVGNIVLDESVTDVLNTLTSQGSTGPVFDAYFELLRHSWQPGTRWPDAFARQLAGQFAPYGLVIFDPRWAGVKELFTGIFAAELSEPRASAAIINAEAVAHMNSMGRKKALYRPPDATNLFYEDGGVRQLISWAGNEFRTGDAVFSKNDMLDLVRSEPERFSPAAALRPVCQDAVFPAAALIAGPGERVYLRQIDPVYSLFGVSRSIPWPRASFTIIDRRTVRTAEKERIPLDGLFTDIDRIRAEYARRTFPEPVEQEFTSFESILDEGFERLAGSIGSIDPTLIDSVRKEKGKVIHTVGALRDRALRAHKARLDLSLGRLASASNFLLPEGRAQERWFGTDAVLSALAGDGFDELMSLTSPGEENHRIIIHGAQYEKGDR